LLHQDPRYFRLGRGGLWHRTGYAISRVFITRTDTGEDQLNYSEFLGNTSSTAISNGYYPRQDRTVGGNVVRFGTQISFDIITDIGKEFWPDCKKFLLRRK